MQFAKQLDQIELRFEELSQQLADPEIMGDGDRYRKVAKAHSDLSEVVAKYREYKQSASELRQAKGMLEDSDPDLRELAHLEVERLGKGRVYLDFLLKIYQAVKSRGRTMQFWSDIVLHYPELIGELPRDVIALDWGYDADHPFEKETITLADARVPFYVCPGTSSWLSITGRTDNAIANLKSAAR